ncbi:hypothetical protein C8034_v005491 [Colletotrichum sidae]|uniref:DUF6536 domain-containing protein n=1 Tax=Colletotrichum sidae TaxID=1347389 RepID=A0A4R8T6L7_9PEZI|nr:hypothetical protein C8034_v005491 [Colletotrichum sidae]
MRHLFGQSLSGWRVSALIFICAIWTLTAVLWVLLAVARSRGGSPDSPVFNISKVFEGDCDSARVRLMALKAFVNTFSTLILVSSNYFMQMLAAPTRADIDGAHRRSRWMDVGIPSMRNLRFVSPWRGVLWCLLALSSLPFHLLFNACVFGSTTSPEWVTAVASEGFLEGREYYLPGVGLGPDPGPGDEAYGEVVPQEVQYMVANAKSWDRLSGKECLEAYSVWINVRNRRHMVAVVDADNNDRGWTTAEKSRAWETSLLNDTVYSLWYAGFYGFHSGNNRFTGSGLATGMTIRWENANGPYDNVSVISSKGRFWSLLDLRTGTWMEELLDDNDNWIISWDAQGAPGNVPLLNETLTVKYCLSEPLVGTCRIRINNDLFLAVCVVALFKSCLCVVVIGYLWKRKPLATIGDAVDSFIRLPDDTTRGMCTLGWKDFSRRSRWRPRKRPEDYGWLAEPRRWEKRTQRWGGSVHVSDWIKTYTIGVLGLILGFVALASFVGEVGGWERAYNWGTFGQDPENPVFALKYPSKALEAFVGSLAVSIVGSSLLSNLPQLGLSITCLLLNVIYTRMFMAREWASYSQSLKPLRVSDPKGQQRSEPFLEIPLPYAFAMQAAGLLLHWLCANSVYAIIVEPLEAIPPSQIVSSSYGQVTMYINILLSFKAAIATMAVFFGMLLVPIILSRCNLSGEVVLAGSCSAAISAACHVLQPNLEWIKRKKTFVYQNAILVTGETTWLRVA